VGVIEVGPADSSMRRTRPPGRPPSTDRPRGVPGADLASIAGEKAGIVKPGVPLSSAPCRTRPSVSSRARPPSARRSFDPSTGRPAPWAGRSPRRPRRVPDGLQLGLGGRFQRDNAAVALALARARPLRATPTRSGGGSRTSAAGPPGGRRPGPLVA
jgi:hypothetical protein